MNLQNQILKIKYVVYKIMNDYLLANKNYWNELALIHQVSDYYSINLFEQGKTTLRTIEFNDLGDITGKSILHLQCHIGLDTLSLVRDKKAIATAIDFSDTSIVIAKELAEKNNIRCEFHCLNIGDVYNTLKQKFDIVFTSYGALIWISDLNKWAEDIASMLEDGGFFYIVDEHPFSAIFNSSKNKKIKITYPYFNIGNPYSTNNIHSYTGDSNLLNNNTQYKWGHSLSEIFASIQNSGLVIESFGEYYKSFYNTLPNMTLKDDGWWYLNKHSESIPLLFTLKAFKK